MKKIICLLLTLMITMALFTGCTCNIDLPKNNNSSNEETQVEEQPPLPTESEIKGAEGLTCSEKYEGVLSEQSYETKNDALTAFVENELSSEVTSAEFVGIKKEEKVDISKSENIKSFNLTPEQESGLESITLITIEYRAKEIDKSPYSSATNNLGISLYGISKYEDQEQSIIQTKKVYLLVINGKAFYLDPLPTAGDPLTKSYFDSVLDAKNYRNCTLEQVSESCSGTSYMGQEVMTKVVQTLLIKRDGDKMLYTLTVATIQKLPDGTEDKNERTSYFYLEEIDGALKVYASTNGRDYYYQPGSPLYNQSTGEPIDNLDDILLFCKYDYSYLEKTSTGFTFKKDYLEKYIKDSFTQLSQLETQYGITEDDLETEMYYYVVDGALYKAVGKIAFDMNVSQEGYSVKINVSSSTNALITDMNKTTVVSPITK